MVPSLNPKPETPKTLNLNPLTRTQALAICRLPTPCSTQPLSRSCTLQVVLGAKGIIANITIWALVISIGFGGILDYNHNKEPQQPYSDY